MRNLSPNLETNLLAADEIMKLEFESNTADRPFAVTDYPAAAYQENSAARVPQMLEAGIKAAQDGNRNEARQLLIQVTEAEPNNETAWLWMASISEYPEELIIFLDNVLSINPNNSRALEWMQATKTLLAKTFVQRGGEALEDANKDFARQCFLQAVVHDSRNETAWQSLADIADSPEEKISHLQKISNFNPDNKSVQDSLQALRKQATDAILQKANRAAISGEREAAKEMLREVLQYAPELEEAWILKAYLADSFSEKITAFEKVLTLNPENEMATVGLTALRATMAKTESRKAEQVALIANFDQKIADEKAAEEILAVSADQIVFDEVETEEDSPTQELEYPPDFVSSEFYKANLHETKTNPTGALVEFSDFHTTAKENQTEENQIEHNPAKFFVETLVCPFCSTENETDAVFCGSCRTILTLSGLEMLFAHTKTRTATDTEFLRQAVGRMEAEGHLRPLNSDELRNLAIGQINLKNFRQGAINLQKAAQMNPNDVTLAAQADSLKIRLAEIEQQESASSRAAQNKKILIVDDSATIRRLISGKIESGGHEAICAADGIEALEKIKEFVPDLILLDIAMPQLDGYQVCKFIRSCEATRDVPVVMISSKDGFFDKVRGRMAGATGYITKPFGPETLLKTVESYVWQGHSAAADAEA